MKMRNVVLGMVLASAPVPGIADEFCDGFKKGYVVGYMQVSGTGAMPALPACPSSPMGSNGDAQIIYELGVQMGLEEGKKQAGRYRR